jgi:outer membrane receptor protein involved in Fe transport
MVLLGANCARAAETVEPSTALSAADSAAPSDAIQEITVTAQRRDESLQNVPITVQAITGEQLKQLNLVSFNDLIKYTPNVTFRRLGAIVCSIAYDVLPVMSRGLTSSSRTRARRIEVIGRNAERQRHTIRGREGTGDQPASEG